MNNKTGVYNMAFIWIRGGNQMQTPLTHQKN